MTITTERLCGLIALIIAFAAMAFQGEGPSTVNLKAGDCEVGCYGR